MNIVKPLVAVMCFFLNIVSVSLNIMFDGRFWKRLVRRFTSRDTIEKLILQKWEREQIEICKKIVLTDTEDWQIKRCLVPEKGVENANILKPKSTSKENKSNNLQQPVTKNILKYNVNLKPEKVPDEIVLAAELIKSSTKLLSSNSAYLEYVGGIDISFLKSDDKVACVALVVVRIPDLEVVYEDCTVVSMDVPYIPGYLSFREVLPSLKAIQRLLQSDSKTIPQVILIDGNGILHIRECGLACHLGVVLDLPTIGVAKNLFIMDTLKRDLKHQEQIKSLHKCGDFFPLTTNEGKVLGMALKTTDSATKPVYVSIGHKISLDTARWLVLLCSRYRIPEPTRQADIKSREYIRKNFL